MRVHFRAVTRRGAAVVWHFGMANPTIGDETLLDDWIRVAGPAGSALLPDPPPGAWAEARRINKQARRALLARYRRRVT